MTLFSAFLMRMDDKTLPGPGSWKGNERAILEALDCLLYDRLRMNSGQSWIIDWTVKVLNDFICLNS